MECQSHLGFRPERYNNAVDTRVWLRGQLITRMKRISNLANDGYGRILDKPRQVTRYYAHGEGGNTLTDYLPAS